MGSFGRDSKSRKRNYCSDLIGSLPDFVLLQILDRLSMKDAVLTALLSKRWGRLWTQMENLVFDHYSEPADIGDDERKYDKKDDDEPKDDKKLKFVNFVNHALELHTFHTVKLLSVTFPYEHRFDSDVDSWLNFVLEKNVQDLHLDLGCSNTYIFPENFYSNRHLKKLYFSSCDFDKKITVFWPALQNLIIEYATLSRVAIKNILLGSEVLEFLKLSSCWGFNRVAINSETLRKFVIEYHDAQIVQDDVLFISGGAAKLESLEIVGGLVNHKFLLSGLSSLQHVNLDFHMFFDVEYNSQRSYTDHRTMMMRLLRFFHFVKQLTIGRWCIQVLSVEKVISGLESPLLQHKCLVLNTSLFKWDLPGIASLLGSSFGLEELVINRVPTIDREFWLSRDFLNSNDFDEESYWRTGNWNFECLRLHLRIVHIFGFTWASDVDLVTRLVEFLLNNAAVLQRMEIHGCSREFEAIRVLVHSFPKLSPEAVVLFF